MADIGYSIKKGLLSTLIKAIIWILPQIPANLIIGDNYASMTIGTLFSAIVNIIINWLKNKDK